MFDRTQVSQFVELIRKDAASNAFEHGLRSMGINPGDTVRVEQLVRTVGQQARGGSRAALEATEVLAKRFPSAVRDLSAVARSTAGSGPLALRDMAFDALNRVGSYHPETYADELQELVRSGRNIGGRAFDQLVRSAQQGQQYARQVLDHISQNAQRYGRYARQATRALQQLGPAKNRSFSATRPCGSKGIGGCCPVSRSTWTKKVSTCSWTTW